MAKPDETLARIAEVARASSGRSKLARWFRIRHDEFLALVEETRPSWEALAKAFAEEGMTTAEGKPFTAETVRVTWYRVRKSVEKSRAKRAETVPPVAVEKPVTPLTPSSAGRDPAPGPDADPMAAQRELARIKREMRERSGLKPEGDE